MDLPINLDDEARGVAVEVGDESVDDLLPAEVQASKTVVAEALPELGFSRRHRAAELARALKLGPVDRLADDDAVGWPWF